jgi:hypothetical protein
VPEIVNSAPTKSDSRVEAAFSGGPAAPDACDVVRHSLTCELAPQNAHHQNAQARKTNIPRLRLGAGINSTASIFSRFAHDCSIVQFLQK